MRENPYKIVSFGDGRYGVQLVGYPQVGLPDSWGSRQHAMAYMATQLGLTLEEYRGAQINE